MYRSEITNKLLKIHHSVRRVKVGFDEVNAWANLYRQQWKAALILTFCLSTMAVFLNISIHPAQLEQHRCQILDKNHNEEAVL